MARYGLKTRTARVRRALLCALGVGTLASSLAGCVPPPFTSGPSGKTVSWKEEVRLASGSLIVVQRTNRFRRVQGPYEAAGWLFEDEVLEANAGDRSVRWEEPLQPIAFDRGPDQSFYVVSVVVNTPGRTKYKVPWGTVHVAFRSEDGTRWLPIPLSEVPTDLQQNLFINSDALFIRGRAPSGTHVDLQTKARLDRAPAISWEFRGWRRPSAPAPKP